jgi:hypothetical protein
MEQPKDERAPQDRLLLFKRLSDEGEEQLQKLAPLISKAESPEMADFIALSKSEDLVERIKNDYEKAKGALLDLNNYIWSIEGAMRDGDVYLSNYISNADITLQVFLKHVEHCVQSIDTLDQAMAFHFQPEKN